MNTIAFRQTDAGRSAAGFTECRDCTVRAYAIAKQIPYADAHAKLKALGRKQRRGWDWAGQFANSDEFELLPEFSARRVEKVLPELPPGRFVVHVRGHVFAVVDGVACDDYSVFTASDRRQITRAVYKVVEAQS